MQAKIYAPTVEERKQALQIAKRFPARRILVHLGLVSAVALAYAWYRTDFALPFRPNPLDVAVGLVTTLILEVVAHIRKTDRAELDLFLEEEDFKAFGPLLYRLTEDGLDWWRGGERGSLGWSAFDKFRLTENHLLLAVSGRADCYWVCRRAEVGEPLLARVLAGLEQHGVMQVAETGSASLGIASLR